MMSQAPVPKSLEFRGFHRIDRAGGHPDLSISLGIGLSRGDFQIEASKNRKSSRLNRDFEIPHKLGYAHLPLSVASL
jgi:hypothetical protein